MEGFLRARLLHVRLTICHLLNCGPGLIWSGDNPTSLGISHEGLAGMSIFPLCNKCLVSRTSTSAKHRPFIAGHTKTPTLHGISAQETKARQLYKGKPAAAKTFETSSTRTEPFTPIAGMRIGSAVLRHAISLPGNLHPESNRARCCGHDSNLNVCVCDLKSKETHRLHEPSGVCVCQPGYCVGSSPRTQARVGLEQVDPCSSAICLQVLPPACCSPRSPTVRNPARRTRV